MARNDLKSQMTGPALHILLSLADAEKHGYAIILDVGQQTNGTVRLSAGTLYGNLKRLLQVGWISENEIVKDLDDPRRRTYRLTSNGQEVLRAELDRMNRIVSLPIAKLVARGANV